jgi:protein TonB
VTSVIDDREPLGKAFFGSIAAHGSLVAAVFAVGYFHLTDNWGSPHASSGSVGVSMVKTIPIAQREAPPNPLANDTKETAPQEVTPVAKPVPKPEVKAPDPKAIALPDRVEKPKKPQPKQMAKALLKPEAYQDNQVYTKSPQAMSSPLYGMRGSGGIDIGPSSQLGTRFGAYVNEMVLLIQQHWNQAGVTAAPSQKCAISFVIARNGTVSNVQIERASGSYELDSSARRAVLDANPLPSLPAQFSGNEVPVTLWFQLKQ